MRIEIPREDESIEPIDEMEHSSEADVPSWLVGSRPVRDRLSWHHHRRRARADPSRKLLRMTKPAMPLKDVRLRLLYPPAVFGVAAKVLRQIPRDYRAGTFREERPQVPLDSGIPANDD